MRGATLGCIWLTACDPHAGCWARTAGMQAGASPAGLLSRSELEIQRVLAEPYTTPALPPCRVLAAHNTPQHPLEGQRAIRSVEQRLIGVEARVVGCHVAAGYLEEGRSQQALVESRCSIVHVPGVGERATACGMQAWRAAAPSGRSQVLHSRAGGHCRDCHQRRQGFGPCCCFPQSARHGCRLLMLGGGGSRRQRRRQSARRRSLCSCAAQMPVAYRFRKRCADGHVLQMVRGLRKA